MSSPIRTTRTRTRLTAGLLLGGALVVALPLAASAHVHVTPENASAEASTTLTFSFSHGCDDSPTTGMIIDIPEGVTNVVPVADAGWSIARDVAENGTVTRVTFTADEPIENGIKGEVSIDARFSEQLAESDVPMPVTQLCVAGSTAWTEVAVDGGAEPESPAPVIAVGAVAAEDEHGGGHDSAAADHDETAVADAAPAAATSTDQTALWLGGGGLALGAIALIVAVLALVRRRRA
ncbi:YcnI family protein [Microbacterium sp. P06]|uniref:YcnI family copper-binding membrane protein n=1 Tax=Microbacterium sp. P06 TaxID=3366949 RepID=UPI00374651F4